MRRGIMRYNEIKRVNNLLCTILLQVNSQHGDRFNISICVSLQCGFSPVFRILKTKIACDLFFRKARTYPRNCFILELIKFTSVKKKKKKKMEGRIGSSCENDDFMSRLRFLLERICKPPFCPREKSCHFRSKVFWFFFWYSEMTVFFNSKTELTSEEKCSKNVKLIKYITF